jgi:hypothetical protein
LEKSKLEELVRQNSKGISFVNSASVPRKTELEKQGYHFVDENEYINKTEAYLSLFYPNNPDLTYHLILKRDFENEFENLSEINKIIPENSVKPIALVYDTSISKDYIRGYITKTDGELGSLGDYLASERKRHKIVDNIKFRLLRAGYVYVPSNMSLNSFIHRYLCNTGSISNIENQLISIVNKLKAHNWFNKLPTGTFSLDNMYLTKKNKVILMNINYLMDFSNNNTKYQDKELKRTMKYLEKQRRKLGQE